MSETFVAGTASNTHVSIASFADSGKVVDKVSVQISYGIIDRFSEGLYSSPNKAFEELVTNSYDAGAENVWVYLPQDLAQDGAVIAVVDDGQSMTKDELHSLWWIGESLKRSDKAPKGRREPVGKFGIGKLATYVLASTLTYIVHRDGQYHAVTMDYSLISPDSTMLMNSVELKLDVVELDRDQAFAAAQAALSPTVVDPEALHILQDDEKEHWTVAILSDLKPAAKEIKLGRLRWVLRTALPLDPSFSLTFNSEKLSPSKSDKAIVWSFTCGRDESDLPNYREEYETALVTMANGESRPAIVLPNAGLVAGVAHLYRDSIKGGKSEELGRSHGFFVRARGRLINVDVDDASFGIDVELQHGTLSRFFMDVEVPRLDDYIASARESVRESKALDELRTYLLAVFNRARNVVLSDDQDNPFSRLGKDNRLSDPPRALTQGPLRRMLRRAAEGEELIQSSLGFQDDQMEELASVLDDTEADIVERIELEPLDDNGRLMSYDPHRRAAVLNSNHPFVGNYSSDRRTVESLKLLGLTELVTEAYMLDEDVPPIVVRRIVLRRDAFLRALVQRYPQSASVVARQLRDARNRDKELEDAVGDALELLGYSVKRFGGSKHGTDGIATARLGRRAEPRSDSYAFTYDTKSSGELPKVLLDDDGLEIPGTQNDSSKPSKIRADTARTSILRLHREEATRKHRLSVEPQFTLLVAPDFQGADDPQSQISKVCVTDGITPISVEDLAELLELFPLEGLNPVSLRPLFDLHTPAETSSWVNKQRERIVVPKPRIDLLIGTLVKFSETKEATNLDHLVAYMNMSGLDESRENIEGLVRGLQALAPNSFYFDGTVVALNATPELLYVELRKSLEEYSEPELVAPYLSSIKSSGGPN